MPAVYKRYGKETLMITWMTEIENMDIKLAIASSEYGRLPPGTVNRHQNGRKAHVIGVIGYLNQRNHLATLAGQPEQSMEYFKKNKDAFDKLQSLKRSQYMATHY